MMGMTGVTITLVGIGRDFKVAMLGVTRATHSPVERLDGTQVCPSCKTPAPCPRYMELTEQIAATKKEAPRT